MAFHQPQRYTRHRPSTSYNNAAPQPTVTVQPSARQQALDDDKTEWIVFSPDSEFAASTSTIRTPLAGQSRHSDFDSLDTRALSEGQQDEGLAQEDDNEDLDSLDDGLHAFNEPIEPSTQPPNVEQSGETVLPTHDGLGLFPGNSSPVQEQFWQHERYNPRRRRFSLRRSNLQQRTDALSPEHGREQERRQRIEKWRVDQSNAILQEIENESRRRRRRASNATSSTTTRKSPPSIYTQEQESSLEAEPSQPASESFWQRFTRKIADLIGIDDATLSFIFGDAVPSSDELESAMTTEERIDFAERTVPDNALIHFDGTWEDKLLARIAKELGVFLQSFTEHPGAFSTYLRVAETPPPYAGISRESSSASKSKQDAGLDASNFDAGSPTSPQFRPTIGAQHGHNRRTSNDPSLWGIEEEADEGEEATAPQTKYQSAADAYKREKEYWEQDLDVKMVFGFLKNKLSRSPPDDNYLQTPPSRGTSARQANPTPSRSNVAASSAHTPQGDSLRRAALIRHHHPLVNRASTSKPGSLRLSLGNTSSSLQPSMVEHQGSGMLAARGPLSPVLGRRTSADYDADQGSCASQSTKRSRTGKGSGSSRNYWDLGAGSVGSWGEV